MKLHEAIRQLVIEFGEEVVAEVRFANLLADFNAYEGYPAMKQILKSSVKAGYGALLLQAYRQEKETVIDKSRELADAFAKETRFKEDLVVYGFDCILYGLGCLSSVNEPLFCGFDPYCKGDEHILDNLSEKLNAFKKQYLDLLDRLIVMPKDILRSASAYYTTDSLNQLYAIEAKIYALQQELKTTDYNWCKEQREAKLSFYFREKSQALVKELDRLKQEYKNLLEAMLVIPKKIFIKYSGYYTTDGLQRLEVVENDIKQVYFNMKLSYDNWCEKEKADYLSHYKAKQSNIILQVFGKICVPVALLIGVLGTTISYVSSSDEITQFEKTVELGVQRASQGDYKEALLLFEKAGNSYKASYRPSYYKNISDNQIDKSVDEVVAKCNDLIGAGKLADANSLLSNLPQEVVDVYDANKKRIVSVKATLTKVVDEGLETLISNIYQNGGHLDDRAKLYLNELLEINSNNYWLMIIKHKENER